MAVNRYSSGSVSKFDPLSLQEVMMVPLMQRQKHDQLIAQQELLKQGLAKVDPLDVHMNEALNLKSQIEDKLTSQAELLSREGVNSNTQGQFLALNREYQNLTSPTGRLGQINAAKVAEATAYKNWMDTEEAKKYGPEIANKRWLDNRSRYTGYDPNRNITNIGQMQAPAYEDLDKDIKEFLTNIGETTTTTLRDYGYKVTPREDGSVIFTDGQGKEVNTTNLPQLQQALERLNQKWVSPNSPGRRSADFAYQNPSYTANQIALGVNSALKTKQDRNQTINRSLQGFKNSKEETPEGNIYDFAPATTVEANTRTFTNNISKLGKVINGGGNTGISYGGSTPGMAPGYRNQTVTKSTNKPFTLSDLPKEDQKEYNTIFEGLKETNLIPKNIKANSPEAYKFVQDYVKNTQTITTQNVIDLGDVMTVYGQSSVGSTKGNNRAKIGEAINTTKNSRMYYDEEENKFYKFSDLPKEVQTAINKNQIKSNGLVTPKNHYGTTVGKDSNKRMFASPIIAEVVLEDGATTKQYLVSRTEGEMSTKSYKADETFNDIWSNATKRPNIYFKKNLNIDGKPTQLDFRFVGPDANGENVFEIKGAGLITEDKLQNLIYANYGVKKN